MRKTVLSLAMMALMFAVVPASADDSRKAPTEQTSHQQNVQTSSKDGSKDDAACAKDEKRSPSVSPNDAEAPQNNVEYGGGA